MITGWLKYALLGTKKEYTRTQVAITQPLPHGIGWQDSSLAAIQPVPVPRVS